MALQRGRDEDADEKTPEYMMITSDNAGFGPVAAQSWQLTLLMKSGEESSESWVSSASVLWPGRGAQILLRVFWTADKKPKGCSPNCLDLQWKRIDHLYEV